MTASSSDEPYAPFLHQPFWCEENIWHLAGHAATAADERLVLVLTGAREQVACWQQWAGAAGAPVFWDYHVVLATRDVGWHLWDLDSRLGCPVPASEWLRATFPVPETVPEAYQPRFAVIPADDYRRRFGSDRSHMLSGDGSWTQPAPPWPALTGRGLTLTGAIDDARAGLDLAALAARLR